MVGSRPDRLAMLRERQQLWKAVLDKGPNPAPEEMDVKTWD